MVNTIDDVLNADVSDNLVVNAATVAEFSNVFTHRIIVTNAGSSTIPAGTTYIGTWEDTTEADWFQSNELIESAGESLQFGFLFEVVDANSKPVFLGGYKWDTVTGKMCIKFGAPLASATRIAIDVTHLRG